MRTLRPAALTAVALLALVACGNRAAVPTEGEPTWQVQELAGERGDDAPLVLATGDDDALVLLTGEDGTVQPHLSRDGGRFEQGTSLATGAQWLQLGGATRLPDGGWFAIGVGGAEVAGGDEEPLMAPVAMRSDDGLRWERVDVTGITGPVDIGDVVATDAGLVVVGAHRPPEAWESEGFRAAVWTSADGERFREVGLPLPPRGDSFAAEVELLGDRVVATGSAGRAGAVWVSRDAGGSWALPAAPLPRGTYQLTHLAVLGDVALLADNEAASYLLRSADGGDTWAKVPAPAGGGDHGPPLWDAGGRFLALASGAAYDAWSRPEVCYADLAQCGEAPRAGVYASEDGLSWRRLDTAGVGEIDSAAGTSDGRALLLTGRGVASWPAGADLPTGDEPAGPRTVEVRMVADGEQPEVGVRYHAPLHVHCGMEWLHLGGEPWRRTDDGPDVETGAGDGAPRGWPLVGQVLYGYATLAANGVLEYSIGDGEVIATYRHARRAPGCD